MNGKKDLINGNKVLRKSELILIILSGCVISYHRNRDSRNKELFEKVFPEIRTKRDQLRDQAYSTVGVRSFGVVRSEAELDQLAYELYEQDEVSY